MGSIVPDKRVKFRDPRLNRSREIPPEAVEGGIFSTFVISGVAVDNVGMYVRVKFGDSIYVKQFSRYSSS